MAGGFDGTSRHASMELYDVANDKWTLLDSTSVCREGAGLISLGLFAFLYKKKTTFYEL